MLASLTSIQAPYLLKMLAHDLRWRLLTALVYSDYRGQELVALLTEPQNLISYHLKQLRDSQLVTEHRSQADRRDIYYSLDIRQLSAWYAAAGEALHPALSGRPAEKKASELPEVRVLFLCTHNSARSQMAEGILRTLAGSNVQVFSAGNKPTMIHPSAIRVMAQMGMDISQQRSKHLDEFCDQPFDYVITVCDRVKEQCPVFPNDPERIHWSFPDPTAVVEPDEQMRAFEQTAHQLMTRIRYLLATTNRKRQQASPATGGGLDL